jgi:hypothetical protein
VFIEPSVAPQLPKTSKAKTAILWFVLGMVVCSSWVIFENRIASALRKGKSLIRRN